MRRTELLQEIRKMRFEEAYGGWETGRLTQAEAARLLGVCERTFRRYLSRYEEGGMEGLIDRRLEQVSHRRAPVDEVMRLTETYRGRHQGWSAKHFYAWYRKDGGARSYTWVKSRLQEAALVAKAKARGAHRKRRERSPWPGLMIHQDGSTHEWIAGQKWDLIVTMDDATNEHYSMFFVEEEGTMSSLQGGAGSHRIAGTLLELLLRPGQPLLAYAGSRWQGGQAAPDAIRAGPEAPRNRDDCRLLAGSPRAL